jgi:hypothetical protein
VVPGIGPWIFGLEASILNRHSLGSPNTLLLHGHTVQISLASTSGANRLAQLLAGIVHALVHAGALLLDGQVLLAAEQLPGAVDGPVAEVAQTGHAQRRGRGREHVLLEGADADVVLGALDLVLAAGGRGGGLFGDGLGGCAGEEGCGG